MVVVGTKKPWKRKKKAFNGYYYFIMLYNYLLHFFSHS